MTKETRANLIFLGIFFVLATPGFCLLMYKKLHNGGGESNAMATPVPSRIAYNQPLPAPPKPRVEPDEVRSWVNDLVRSHLGRDARMPRNGEGVESKPVVSDNFVTQLVGLIANQGTIQISLLHWDDRADLAAERPMMQIDFADGLSTQVETSQPEPIDIPKLIRHALQEVGYIDPPPRAWWITKTIPKATGAAPIAVRLVAGGKSRMLSSKILLKPPATQPAPEATP